MTTEPTITRPNGTLIQQVRQADIHGVEPEDEKRGREMRDAYGHLVEAYGDLVGLQAASDWDEHCTRRCAAAVNGD